MLPWHERIAALQAVAEMQLFFVGGAPRSGTTWAQHLLDAHPAVLCRGEGLFMQHLAEQLDALWGARRSVIAAKNDELFGELGGFPLPTDGDADLLLGTAVLASLAQVAGGGVCQAVGEKTPENVFLFPRLKRLFPAAKFIGMARDPRDVLASTWHLFHKKTFGEDNEQAKLDMVRRLLPSLDRGTRAMLALRRIFPDDTMNVTYEALQAAPAAEAAKLFRFLGVDTEAAVVAQAVAHSAFETLSRGRPRGTVQEGFLRKGIAGDWAETLSPAMNALIVSQIGWAFPHFGWTA